MWDTGKWRATQKIIRKLRAMSVQGKRQRLNILPLHGKWQVMVFFIIWQKG